MAERKHKKPRSNPEPKHVNRVHRIIWSKPSPTSVYISAADAMRRANSLILESTMRRLARAEANGMDGLIAMRDVLNWLDELQEHIQFLREHIGQRLSESEIKIADDDQLQRDIERIVPERSRRRCANAKCDRWFVPIRSTGKYCSDSCRVEAYRTRQRMKGLPYH